MQRIGGTLMEAQPYVRERTGEGVKENRVNEEAHLSSEERRTLLEEIERRGGDRHTVLERTGPPVFDCVVEIVSRGRFLIHLDVAQSVDNLLKGLPPKTLIRQTA